MTKNMVSIIVPVYNTEKYLEKCINSLLNQSYKNIEILLINDGSTDNSDLICNKCKEKDSRIKYYKKKNTGVSDTRNYGIKIAKGDYITFVDSDDWLDVLTLEECMKVIINEEIDILKFSYVRELGKIKKYYKFSVSTNEKIYKNNYHQKLYDYIFNSYDLSNSCNCIFKKGIIGEIVFDKNIKNGEDFKFMIDVLINSNSIYFINESYYHYYYNLNSATNSLILEKLEKKIHDFISVYKYVFKKMKFKDNEIFKVEERIKRELLSIQFQISSQSYKIYINFIKNIENYLEKEKITYQFNKRYIYYLYIKTKFKLKNIVKKLLNKISK